MSVWQAPPNTFWAASEVPKLPESCLSAKQEGLQSAPISKLQFALRDGTCAIHTYRDFMVSLRFQLADAGRTKRSTVTSSNPYHCHWTSSLRSMMILAMILVLIVTSLQNIRWGRNLEKQRRERLTHFRRLDLLCLDSSRQRRRRRRRREKRGSNIERHLL